MESLLQDLGELSDEEAERMIKNLLLDSRSLGALLLRLRPSRQLRDLLPIPTFSFVFGVGTCGRFARTFVNFLSRTDT